MLALSQFCKGHTDWQLKNRLPEPTAWVLHGPDKDAMPLDMHVWQASQTDLDREGLVGNQLPWKKLWSSELEGNLPGMLQNEFLFCKELKLTSFVEKMMPVPLRLSFGRRLSRIDGLLGDLSSKSWSSHSAQAKKDCFGFSDLHLGFFSSCSRSSWLVLYYKGVIKPNEMEAWCPTTSVTCTPSFIRGYPGCQLSPNHPDLLLWEYVRGDSLPPALRSKCSMDYYLIYLCKMENIPLSLSVTSNRLYPMLGFPFKQIAFGLWGGSSPSCCPQNSK